MKHILNEPVSDELYERAKNTTRLAHSLLKETRHQKKVIDRLSRKIQKLKKENNNLWITHQSQDQLIELKANYNFDLINRIFKAIEILEQCNVDIDSVRLCEDIGYAIYILKGSDINDKTN